MLAPLAPRRVPSRVLLSTVPLWLGLLWLLASGVTCATGTMIQGNGGATGSSSNVASTSSGSTGGASSSSTAGSGGASASSTSSAGGGSSSSVSSTSSSSSSTASSSSSSATSSSSSSAGAPGTILTAYANGNGMACVNYSEATMMGFAQPYIDQTMTSIGITLTGSGEGVVVIRSEPTGELRFARWTGMWIPSFGAPLLPVQAGLFITGGPSLAGSSTKAHAAYLGTDGKFYYAEEFNGSWFPTNEPVTSGGLQSFGPTPPAIATLANVPILAFIGQDGNLYDQTRNGGVWQAASAHGVPGQGANITPAIVAMSGGPELLVVYTVAAGHGLSYTLRTAGTWSAPAPIPSALSNDQVTLAPLTAGGAVLSFRGQDGHLYTSLLSANAPYTWSAPVAGVMGSNPMLQSPPAIATGAMGAQAELVYLDTNFTLQTARMNNGAWGAAAFSGAASYRVAVATGK